MTPFPQLIISVNSSSYHHHLINNAKKALMMMIIIIIIMASDAQLVSEKNNIDRLGIRQVYLYSTISLQSVLLLLQIHSELQTSATEKMTVQCWKNVFFSLTETFYFLFIRKLQSAVTCRLRLRIYIYNKCCILMKLWISTLWSWMLIFFKLKFKLKWLQRYLLLNHETLKHYKTVGMGIKLPWNFDMFFFSEKFRMQNMPSCWTHNSKRLHTWVT